MDYTQKIMEIVNQNNGFITSMQVTKENISRVYLKKHVNKGMLEHSERGVYTSPHAFDDDMFNLQNRL